jgi:hypothetical protein
MFVDLGVCAGLCVFNVTLARAQDAPSSRSCLLSLTVTAARSPERRKEIAHRKVQSWSCASQQKTSRDMSESRKVYPIHLQIGTLSSGDGREDLCGDH